MTPLPKKKHAKSRTRTRKAAINFSLPKLVTCSNCKELKVPHRVCPHCGFYKVQKETRGINKTQEKSTEIPSTTNSG